MYQAGELKHLIRIQQCVELGVDARGCRISEWRDICEMYAAVNDVSGRDFYQAAALHMENIMSMVMRYNADIRPDMRVIFNGHPYDIVQINHLGYRGDWMTLKLRTVTSEGGSCNGTV